ncbi:MAG: glutarate dioxygenase GlaH, partial [SAR324 cluster bacterium]|nr:glutarate dioxygenase GlaH [SAR324 cluster bacterium]
MRSFSSYPKAELQPRSHSLNPRLQELRLPVSILENFLAATSEISVQELEYVPYQRQVLAHTLNEECSGSLKQILMETLHDRATGALEISTSPKLNKDDLIKISTAVSHLLGQPNFDSMSGKYYACFDVKDTDNSDSYLRQAYRLFTLHTDGTYVDEVTDWVLMLKLKEENAVGGESRLLHLDDWEEMEIFANHPLGHTPMEYRSPPSKNVSVPVKRQTFYQRNGRPCLCFIDQFAYPHTIEQALFLRDMSQSMENSSKTLSIPLPAGNILLINNHFWAHGREPFEKHPKLFRALLRQRGAFN